MKIPQDMIVGKIHQTNRYGPLKILSYIDCYKVLVLFVETGFIASFEAQRIRNGTVKDKMLPIMCGVGFIGVGDYKTGFNGVHTRAHAVWSLMIARRYDKETQYKYPTYKGVTICKHWHNFQNFAEWFYLNYIEGYDLDKDKLQRGVKNKVYSPETCVFISKRENIQESHATNYKFKSPSAVTINVYNLTQFCRENNLTQPNMHKVHQGERSHHKGWTKA